MVLRSRNLYLLSIFCTVPEEKVYSKSVLTVCENVLLFYFKVKERVLCRLPQMLYNLQASGAKTFLLTNSEWKYTNQVRDFELSYIFP